MCCFYTIGLSRVYCIVFLILNTKQWTLNNAVCSLQCAVCNIEPATLNSHCTQSNSHCTQSNSHCTQPSALHFLNCTTHTAGPSRTKDSWQWVFSECVGTTVLAVKICKNVFLMYSVDNIASWYETMWIQGYQVVPGEDKTHSSWLIFRNHNMVVPNKSWNPLLPSHAYCSRQNKIFFYISKWKSHENSPFLDHFWCSFSW